MIWSIFWLWNSRLSIISFSRNSTIIISGKYLFKSMLLKTSISWPSTSIDIRLIFLSLNLEFSIMEFKVFVLILFISFASFFLISLKEFIAERLWKKYKSFSPSFSEIAIFIFSSLFLIKLKKSIVWKSKSMFIPDQPRS